ncbi:MAG: 6-phosphogluconolactonase [Ferruginibacter sp.]|nr:6-phosphogluconolactonase [Ferruginibacter sp.]
MKLNIFETVDELLANLAEYFVGSANQSIAEHGRFSVALSGGSSPAKLYGLLASPSFRERVDWNKVYFFLGDERYVPLTDPESNFKMVNQVFFEPLQIKADHIFPVNTALSPADAAIAYMEDIDQHFTGDEPVFDLVLLGLGDNAHTASLFPFTAILQEKTATIKSVFITSLQSYRISFTAPLINLARRVAFLVYGEGKATAVSNILEGAGDIENFPARLIKPVEGELEWFLDKSAAFKIKSRQNL